MTEQEILAKLIPLAATITGKKPAELDIDTPLLDLGVDSLGLADFLFEIDDAFGLEVDPSKLVDEGLNTLRKIAGHIAQLKAA